MISSFIFFLFPLLSSFPHLYHVFPIHSGCLTTTLLHQTHLCTSSSLPLSFSRGSGTVSLQSTKHILFQLLLPKLYIAFWPCLRPGFVQKTQQPLLHSLTTSPSLTPPVRLGRVEVLVFSFLTIVNTQLILPYAIITHWNPMLLL